MTIFQITLSMTVMILLLLIFEKVLGKKFSAKCRYILWAVIMIRLAVPLNIPIYTIEVPEFIEEQTTQPHIPADTAFSVPSAVPETMETTIPMPTYIPDHDTRVTETTAPSSLPAESAPVEVKVSYQLPSLEEWPEIIEKILDSVYIKAFYIAGAVIFAACKLTAHGIYTSHLKRNRRLADEETYKIYRGLTEKYRIKHPPALYVNDAVASPMLYGFFKPCILLPSCCMTADPNAAVVVLSHELTHFRRGDLWIKLIGLLGTSLHWFNPFVHLAFRRCTQAMELSCDETVLKGLGKEVRQSYGNVMLDIVKRCRNNGEALTTHFNPRKNAVTERFLNILDTRKKRQGVVIIALVLLLCVAGCTVSLDRSADDQPAETEDTEEKTEDTSEAAKDISGETEETKPPLSENEQLTKELNNARAELLRQIDVLTDEYNAHSEQMAELFEKLSALHSQDYKWQNEERLIQEQIASLQAKLEEMQEQDAAAENELSLLRAQAEDIQSWLNDYAAQEDAIKSEMSVHQQQLDALDNKIKDLRAQEAEIKTQFIELLVKMEEENAAESMEEITSKRNKAYRLWMNGMISMEALIGNNDYIREDMAAKVNEIIEAFRDGKNPMELLPDPPTLEKPVTAIDFNDVPYVTADEITTLYFDAGGETPENGKCTHKFTIPIDGKTYANEYMDLYWSIGLFGESCTMYINHIEIYRIQDRLSEEAASLPVDRGFHYITRFPNSGAWLCAGNSEDGELLLYYTPNNGDSFYQMESEIPDKTYDTATVAATLHSGGSMEMQIIAELEKDGEYEYVSFNNYSYTDYPYTFTYAGAVAYEELVNILAMYPAFSYVGNFDFPNKNVPDGMKAADDPEELSDLGLDENDGRLRYIRALLDKDVETLESLCFGAETGMYADYADLHITKWLVQVDMYPNTTTPRVTLSFRAYRSSIDAFPEGNWNTFIVQDGMYGVYLYSTVQDVYEGAAGELSNLLNHVYFQSIPNSDDMDQACRWCLTEFICTKLTEKNNKLFHTSAEIKAYAEKVFGIENFTPAQTHLSYGESHIGTVREDLDPELYNIEEMKMGDIYASVPHGGISHAFRITEFSQTEDSATILVQFYADISRTVRSHLYQYQMEKADGDWTYTGCTKVSPARYEPFCRGT